MPDNIAKDILTRAPMRDLRSALPDMAAGYRAQDVGVSDLSAALGGIGGRKIAFNSAALMAHFGLNEPAVARVYTDHIYENQHMIIPSRFSAPALEPEITVQLARDIPAGLSVSKEALQDYLAGAMVSFELLDRKNAAELPSASLFVAYNIFNAGLMKGDRLVPMAELPDASAANSRFTFNDEVLLEGANTAPQDPIEAASFVVNHFTSRGQGLKAGELIMCGTHYPPVDIAQEGVFEFSIEGMGQVSLSISAA